MSKDIFIVVMRTIHKALFELHSPADKDESEVLLDLINTYISMIAGFDQKLYEILRTWLTSHKTVSDDEIGELYDALTSSPADGMVN